MLPVFEDVVILHADRPHGQHLGAYPSMVKSGGTFLAQTVGCNLRSQPAFATATTIDPNEEVRPASDLIEGVKHEHAVNDHRTATIQAARNSAVEVCREPLDWFIVGQVQVELHGRHSKLPRQL